MNCFGQQCPFDLSNERTIKKENSKKCRFEAAFFQYRSKTGKSFQNGCSGKKTY